MEYALSRNISSTMILEYRTKLISKEILQKKLEELYEAADESQNSQQQSQNSSPAMPVRDANVPRIRM